MNSKERRRLLKIRSAMILRCTDPDNPRFKWYGARGIRVCTRWILKPETFLRDIEKLGPRPPGFSLDRIDNDGDYRPGNVRWADQQTQKVNRRRSVMLTFQGETLTASEWSRRLNINVSTITQRIRLGWTVEQALTATPWSLRRGQSTTTRIRIGASI